MRLETIPLSALKEHIDVLERKRNALPHNTEERDELSEELDMARDIYEDRI